MPRRARDRRSTNPLAQLAQRLDKVSGDGSCVATILPLIGLAMKCVRPCTRCTALAAEVEALQPAWDAEKAAWRAANPETRTAKPAPAELVVEDDDL
jgi:hypothetical protein